MVAWKHVSTVLTDGSFLRTKPGADQRKMPLLVSPFLWLKMETCFYFLTSFCDFLESSHWNLGSIESLRTLYGLLALVSSCSSPAVPLSRIARCIRWDILHGAAFRRYLTARNSVCLFWSSRYVAKLSSVILLLYVLYICFFNVLAVGGNKMQQFPFDSVPQPTVERLQHLKREDIHQPFKRVWTSLLWN